VVPSRAEGRAKGDTRLADYRYDPGDIAWRPAQALVRHVRPLADVVYGFVDDLVVGVEEPGVAVEEERRSRSRDLPQPAHRTSGMACNDARIMHQM
jgi:hypothetical protein